MGAYIIAALTLLIYWQLHYSKEGGALAYIKSNQRTALLTVLVMLVVVYFRAIVTPYLALPVVVSIVTAYMSGSLLDKVAKIIQWAKDKLTSVAQ